ncbi:hypothetical protein H6G20_08660 [Desertifilum sp. FACHB-1129]|uniref:Bacterial toxin 24 domain-containing protein n=2 Tax=Desertifilum tharense IPPAS B-1220 TaxID=1781255 RepID=A0A1E5QHM6_9CYAN|nr:polymorphic toxin type 24 domain-containing protein [Desertifilum tharense]MBD2311728.1 hypothetical protein [Desertifilum sp. FACHB-1129]MBD2322747.1 hypothetical protein [Desertifilum sp. FACHB-866]MBD2332859.1 hypothetical protein [Desertifilum sp. FACHB-868]MCD8486379.1 polymorphic toxin type 24 domain-containing protein [Desertifilum sp.]MDA0212396.1 polymorphic toxin type 24 domain-containing protein [Cyanobacteria bacterium FC1]MDI9641024.1 polymorphic toxin type 24 domain-containin
MPKPIDWTVGIPARTLIANGKQVSGHFPLEGEEARAILYRRNESNLTSYIVYDEEGKAIKRVDLTGKAHAGIPTPHVVEYSHHQNSQKKIFVQANKRVRPAMPDEIP